MKSIYIDPISVDIVKNGKGGFMSTDNSSSAVVAQLNIEHEAWPGNPDAGSRLHDLKSFEADPVNLVAAEARRCLGVLVSAGRIANLSVKVKEVSAGRLQLDTEFRDVGTGQTIDVSAAKVG